jgi:hypothetical protein
MKGPMKGPMKDPMKDPGKGPRKNRAIPLFLERRSYRQRRLMDAARLLPVLGALLWLVPLLWPQRETSAEVAAVSTSNAILYIFGVWVVLALIALLLSLLLDAKAETQGESNL